MARQIRSKITSDHVNHARIEHAQSVIEQVIAYLHQARQPLHVNDRRQERHALDRSLAALRHHVRKLCASGVVERRNNLEVRQSQSYAAGVGVHTVVRGTRRSSSRQGHASLVK